MRNGPNPAFPPISYTYPFDGDGMIHAIYIKNGRAAYRNRFVETTGFVKERKADKALYGGLLHPIPMDPKWAGPEDEVLAVKNGAFIHVIRHAGNYLAMSEGSPAYQLSADLQTRGEWDPYHNKKPIDICAHTRLDPHTGELWFINYSLIPPFLTIYRVDQQGKIAAKWDIDKPNATMIHDFVLTKNYVIIVDCPVVFDLEQIKRGGPLINWQPEAGTRIGVMSRHDGKMRWLQTEPFFVFHFANAYEHDNDILIDLVRHENFSMTDTINDKPPFLHRIRVNLTTGKITHTDLDDSMIEFPRIRDDHDSLPHQFIYTPTRTSDIHNPRAFNALIKYDVKNQKRIIRDVGKFAEIGEVVFAPTANKNATEDDGYLLLFVYDSTTNESECVVLDAKNIAATPLARIQMPRRIPHGLHGSWMPGEWE